MHVYGPQLHHKNDHLLCRHFGLITQFSSPMLVPDKNLRAQLKINLKIFKNALYGLKTGFVFERKPSLVAPEFEVYHTITTRTRHQVIIYVRELLEKNPDYRSKIVITIVGLCFFH